MTPTEISYWRRKLAASHGIPAARVERMRDVTIERCATRPNYLAAVKRAVQSGQQFDPEPIDDAVTRYEFSSELRGLETRLLSALRTGSLTERRVLELIDAHAPRLDETRVRQLIAERLAPPDPIILVEEPGEEPRQLPDRPRHSVFPRVLAAATAGVNVVLVGPAGCGKTTLADQVAEVLELPFGHTGAVATRYELSGFRDAGGGYQKTEFRERFENGGVFLADECDASAPAALLFLNTALSHGHCSFPDGNVKRHPDFRFLGAMNTFGRGANRVYVGRNPLDGASLDRFAFIEMGYDEHLERRLYGATPWVDRVHAVRHAVDELKLRHIVSTRAIDVGARLLAVGLEQSEVEAMTLWKGLEADQVAKIQARC